MLATGVADNEGAGSLPVEALFVAILVARTPSNRAQPESGGKEMNYQTFKVSHGCITRGLEVY